MWGCTIVWWKVENVSWERISVIDLNCYKISTLVLQWIPLIKISWRPGSVQRLQNIEIRLECRCLQKCFLIWNYYVCCLWAPLLVLTQRKETVFFWSNLVFFYNKSKILTILFIVKYEKITLFDEFLVLLGHIISRFFACSNEEKGCYL